MTEKAQTEDLIEPVKTSSVVGRAGPRVVYLAYEQMRDGRIGMGVYTSAERAAEACRANADAAPLFAIRPALIDGPMSVAKDKI